MEITISNEEKSYIGHPPLILHLKPVISLTDDEFYEFCQTNRDIRVERNAQGELILMPPTGGETSEQNAEITMQLRLWAKHDATGVSFDSSGGLLLPNGAVRSPDAAWVENPRLARLFPEERKKFVPLCPDFVLELRSPTDSLSLLQDKMQEYIDSGAQLGFLIDPTYKRVYVYRPQGTVEELEEPDTVSGDPILPGFILDLKEVW